MTIILAPKASIAHCLLFENASENTAINFKPKTAETKANAVPVLPPVYSITVSPGDNSPLSIALVRPDNAIRSLYEPVGLPPSSFSQTSAELLGTIFSNRTRGVFPIALRAFFL